MGIERRADERKGRILSQTLPPRGEGKEKKSGKRKRTNFIIPKRMTSTRILTFEERGSQ